MKILAIRICNLASLVGETELRLDKEPLGPTGLFAISGPTGSGKSTLLDAMCLALFARTPRLQSKGSGLVGHAEEDPKDRLRSQDPRGLLSRGCGRGFAEVDFRGQDGRSYRARWSVRRARDKPDGRIQKDQITLTDIESGERLGEHKKDSLELIQQKLGLEYDQFRRSVLLAQGDFAAFLEADPSERGELLESITGTEIYSRLSRGAHERAKAEKDRLDVLQARSEGLVTLGDEDRAARKELEARLTEKQRRLTAERLAFGKAVEWHERQRELTSSETRARERLFVSLRGLREKAGLAIAAWTALEGELCQAEPLVAIWRDLQRELTEEVEKLAKSEAELAEWRRAATKARKELREAEEEAVSSENELAAALQLREALGQQDLANRAWFAKHEEWRELCTQWPRWKQELDRARQVAFDLSELLREKNATELSLAAYEKDLVEARAQHQSADEQQGQAEKELGDIAKELAGLDLDALLAERDRLHRCRRAVDDLLSLSGRKQALEANRQHALKAAKEQGQLLEQTRMAIEQAGQKKLTLDSARKETRRQLESLLEKQSLEDHRKKLRAGEACPLCGALEHPYATDLVVEILDEVQELVAELDGEAEAIQRQLQELSSDIGSQEVAQREALTKANAAEEDRLAIDAEARDLIAATHADWHEEGDLVFAKDEAEREGLAEMRKVLQGLEEAQAQQIDHRNQVEKRHREVAGKRDKARVTSQRTLEAQRGLEADLQKAELGIQYAAQNAERLKGELEKLLDGLEIALRARSGWRELFYGERDLLFEELDQISLAWATRTEEASSITKQVVELESGLQGKRSLGEERRKRANTLKKELESRVVAIAEREARDRAWLGGQKSQVLRDMLVNADKQAVLVKERFDSLQKHGAKKPEQDEQESREAVEDRAGVLEKIGTEVESVRFELRADKEARDKLAAMGPAIKAQRERSEIWRALADLIGSYDGRKFRDFAQSLSLDAMVAQANHHLAQLSPRYRLQRVPGQDLDLQIQDLYMGDEVRSVHSLSGGESFLVSLALALGLSSMHASQCSLESLFIDEGFGSLDEESLEVAVAALDALQSTGRQIGLISHVAGLAERIGREVKVRPLGGGRSKLVY